MTTELLEAVARAWEVFPMLRLGQLLENAVPQGRTLYYVEDKELIKLLDAYVEEHRSKVIYPKTKGSGSSSHSPRSPQSERGDDR